MIKIPASLLREIYGHTEESYPNECCGLMIGTTDKDKNHTVQAFRTCKNLNQERARDRYDMDPLDMLRVEREFEKTPWARSCEKWMRSSTDSASGSWMMAKA